MILNPDFNVTPLFDAEYLSETVGDAQYSHNGILTGTYTCLARFK